MCHFVLNRLGAGRNMGTKHVLLTGGCGFIGSALVRHLVGTQRVRVLNVDKLTYAGDPSTVAEVSSDPLYGFEHVDVCDSPTLERVLDSFRPDAIIHLAAESHVDRSIDGPSEFIRTNVFGTFALLETALHFWQSLDGEAKERFRFLHVSTDEVYGSLPLDGNRFTEDSQYAPNSPYAASKAGSDHLARAWWRTYGLPVIISNCSNNYGPYQFPEKLIPTILIAALEGRPLPIYGQGTNVRDWIFVDDHVRALTTIVERGSPGETYLVGGGSEMSNLDLVRSVCAILDEFLPTSPWRPHEKLITFVPDRPGHDLRYAVDDTRLRTQLGWFPVEDLKSGLRQTVSWYLDNRTWWQQLRRDRYAGDRLGLATVRESA